MLNQHQTGQMVHRDRARTALVESRRLQAVLAATCLLILLQVPSAHAGTYTIYDCPSANNSSSAGPWTISGGEEQKTSCSGGYGDFIGPLRGSMSPNSEFSMAVYAPAGETLTQATVWWYMPQSQSGAHMYAQEWSGGTLELEAFGPYDSRFTPDTHTLPAGATSFTLGAYCSSDDGPNGCNFPSAQTPEIEMHGSAITVSDPTPPSGNVTGGPLSGSGPVGGSQSISYAASDGLSGIYSVALLIDGKAVATNNYTAQCPYTNFLACPASQSDSFTWDTAGVADGPHEVALLVTNTAGDTTLVGDHAITTHNSPTITSPPTISGSPVVGQSLTVASAKVNSDPGAGSLKTKGEWQRCNSSGASCMAIAGTTGSSYNAAAADEGHTLRYQETVSNNDGSTVTESAAFGPIQKETTEAREAREAREAKGSQRSKGSERGERSPGSQGSEGSPGSQRVQQLWW